MWVSIALMTVEVGQNCHPNNAESGRSVNHINNSDGSPRTILTMVKRKHVNSLKGCIISGEGGGMCQVWSCINSGERGGGGLAMAAAGDDSDKGGGGGVTALVLAVVNVVQWHSWCL